MNDIFVSSNNFDNSPHIQDLYLMKNSSKKKNNSKRGKEAAHSDEWQSHQHIGNVGDPVKFFPAVHLCLVFQVVPG